MKMKSRKLTAVLLIVYLAVLTWIIVFKMQFPGDPGLPHMRNVNLIPFGQSVIVNNRVDMGEIIQNGLAFVPYGLLLGSLLQKLLPIVLTSLVYECVQYVLAIGASDITDLIMNSLGGLAGIGIALVLSLVLRRSWQKVINVICLIGAILLGLLMVILFIAN